MVSTEMSVLKVWNVEKCMHNGAEVDVKPGNRHVFFVVLGNKSKFMQAQPIVNSLHTYLSNVLQAKEPVCMSAYVFDFKERPSVFSHKVLQDQGAFVALMVDYVMSQHPGASFSMITHSVGAYVAYDAMTEKKFPLYGLKNVFNLAGPLGDIPLKFYGGLEQLFLKMIKRHNY